MDEDYVPTEQDFIDGNVTSPEEARRGLARIKADSLREAADALPEPVGLHCNSECHAADKLALRIRADGIEKGDRRG
ncbi:hypothetical protein DFO66_103357 [Brevibacterium sanguinis]|uniref:Uncharacterized protein n=2 Tax=Brevibacterium TaxID=1696 RepID=A0A366IKX1_9MICO|nr:MULTISPECIES: hypothetical protein [Brevibacterium]RBP66410.1 hypothetical protein DFO66_103357 [Brevibacterium sanguinis]RBP73062.1 hypothetical protein DFO65_103357 [Brevibacterium celere]